LRFTPNLRLAPHLFAIVIFCLASGFKNYLFIAYTVVQWGAFGIVRSIPIVVFWLLNSISVAFLSRRQPQQIGGIIKLAGITAANPFLFVAYLFVGVGGSLWMLAVAVPSSIQGLLKCKGELDRFKTVLGNLAISNLISIVVCDLSFAVVMFASLPTALEPNILMIINILVLMGAHVWYFRAGLELTRQQREETAVRPFGDDSLTMMGESEAGDGPAAPGDIDPEDSQASLLKQRIHQSIQTYLSDAQINIS
jgi:hypothetical protein